MIRKIIGISLLILFFSIIIINNAKAQKSGETVVLLQGRISDISGNPVGTTLNFIGNNGKKISAKSNSKDGTYQQVMTPGVTYNLLVKGYMVNDNIEVDIPKVTEYTELSRNFTVKKIEEGLNLMKFVAFNPNQSTLKGEYSTYFTTLKDFLRDNINASVVITVGMNDSYFKPTEKKIQVPGKKGKTVSKKVKVTPEEQLSTLADERINSIKDYFASITLPEKKISFVKDLKQSSTKKADKQSKTNTKKGAKTTDTKSNSAYLTIKVGRIADL